MVRVSRQRTAARVTSSRSTTVSSLQGAVQSGFFPTGQYRQCISVLHSPPCLALNSEIPGQFRCYLYPDISKIAIQSSKNFAALNEASPASVLPEGWQRLSQSAGTGTESTGLREGTEEQTEDPAHCPRNF